MKLNTVSLFAGGGGLDLGFAAAGFNLVYTTDIDSFSCETLRINQNRKSYYNSHVVEEHDIKNLKPSTILEKAGLKKGDVDFVIGGPPCQAFSVFGKRKGQEDPRGNLVFEYARIIKELNPVGFLFENVSGLRTIHEGKFYADLLETLSFKGKYKVSAHEYEVAEYGIPQFRSRVIIIGSLHGVEIPKMDTTHTAPEKLFNGHVPYNTVKKALSGIPKLTDSSNILFNHIGREHSQRIIDRYRALSFGERDSATRINKLHPNRPSYTIIVGSDKGGGKGHVHPYQAREVTPRESARIQTFPDWWQFHGTGRHVIRQVGNAVPPLFAAQLGFHIKNEIFNIKQKPDFASIAESLGLGFLSRNDN